MDEPARPQDAWDILARTARCQPDSLAVVDTLAADNATITYRQLYRRAAGLAAFLRRTGVGRGDMVAVMLHNCRQARLPAARTLRLDCEVSTAIRTCCDWLHPHAGAGAALRGSCAPRGCR